MTLLIIGAGGHGRDIAATARALNLAYRFCDDDPELWMPVPERWDDDYTIGVGEPSIRRALVSRHELWAPATLVDPRAIVGEDCHIGVGAVVGPGCVLVAESTIGEHAHLTYNISGTRLTLGDFVSVGPGVSFAGYVTVGAGAYIGAGATIINKVTIGEGARVGAGSVVIRDVPDHATVMGVPAKVWAGGRTPLPDPGKASFG